MATGYVYRVCAVAPYGQVVCAADVTATTLATTAPTGLTATAVSLWQINLSWTDAATNETGYQISRRLASGTTWSVLPTLPANARSYSDTGLVYDTSYTYRVCAIAPGGQLVCAPEVTSTTFTGFN